MNAGVPGAYFGKNFPPPGRGGISADIIWGKDMKRGNRKKRKLYEKREKRRRDYGKWKING
jgi:hypothetical protein